MGDLLGKDLVTKGPESPKERVGPVSAEYQGAMPRLYGAPAYTRPPQHHESERPFDPDDLPLEAHRTDADDAVLVQVAGSSQDDEAHSEHPSFLRRNFLPFSFGGRRS